MGIVACGTIGINGYDRTRPQAVGYGPVGP